MWLIAGTFAALVCALIYFVTGIDSVELAKFKIISNHFQITALCLNFKLSYPDFFLRVVNILLSVVSFDFIELSSPECSTGSLSFVQRWLLTSFVPLMLMFPFCVFPFLKLLCASLEVSLIRSLSTMSVIASITFVWSITKTMEIWACFQDSLTGDSYLIAAPEIKCQAGNSKYDTLLAMSVILFMVYFFGTQLFLFVASASDEPALSRTVTGGFKEGCESWFLVVNTFKWLTVIASLFLASHPVGQAAMEIVLVCIMLIATLGTQPYIKNEDSYLESSLLGINLLYICVGLLGHQHVIGESLASGLLFAIMGFSFILSVCPSLLKWYQSRKDNEVVSTLELENRL
jgi:hypothetical protein